jgi:hypothetical protein
MKRFLELQLEWRQFVRHQWHEYSDVSQIIFSDEQKQPGHRKELRDVLPRRLPQ